MQEEQINEAIQVEQKELHLLKHIKKRIKNQEGLTRHVINSINSRNFLNVGESNCSISGER